jgi:hypothetical protein
LKSASSSLGTVRRNEVADEPAVGGVWPTARVGVNAAKAAPAKTSVTRLAAPTISMRNFSVIPLLFFFQPLGRLRLIA